MSKHEQHDADAVIAQAAARARSTRELNLDQAPALPVADTANLRLGANLNDACLSVLPLVGVWRGTGSFGNQAAGASPDFGQQVTFSHDGRDFLRYESVTWSLPETAPAQREVGFLRPQPDGSVELLLAHATGRIEVFYGQAHSKASWNLSTDAVWRTPTAEPVIGATRLLGITMDGRLAYVEERAYQDKPLAPYASALLSRVVG